MRALTILSFAMLAACGGSDVVEPAADETAIPKSLQNAPRAPVKPVAEGLGTPNEERIATIGLLNKRNNLTQDLVLKTGESRRVGKIIIKLESCDRSFPWEAVEEEGAFVQIFLQDTATSGSDGDWRKAFSGWLFKNSPSLNVFENPIYDVWVKDCAMKFPGEEDGPAAAASPTSAANAAGNDSGPSASE